MQISHWLRSAVPTIFTKTASIRFKIMKIVTVMRCLHLLSSMSIFSLLKVVLFPNAVISSVSTASGTYLVADPLFRVLTAEVLVSVRVTIVLAWWVYHWDVLLFFMVGGKWQKPERTVRQYSWLDFQRTDSEKTRVWNWNTCAPLQPWPLSGFWPLGLFLSYLANDGDTQTILLGFSWVLNISWC